MNNEPKGLPGKIINDEIHEMTLIFIVVKSMMAVGSKQLAIGNWSIHDSRFTLHLSLFTLH